MTQIFLTFGDSWPAAVKLSDKSLSFPSLIAKELGFEILNLSEPATSIEHAVMALLHFLETQYNKDNKYLALCCLTDPSRNMIWEPAAGQITDPPETFWAPSCYTREMQINNNHPSVEYYYKYIQTERMDTYNYVKNVILFSTLCEKFNIDLYFVNNFNTIELQFKLTNGINIYPRTLREILKTINYNEVGGQNNNRNFNPVYVDHTGHPTVAGHRMIADALISWIKQ